MEAVPYKHTGDYGRGGSINAPIFVVVSDKIRIGLRVHLISGIFG